MSGYVFVFPAGTVTNLPVLNWSSLEFLRYQCPNREIVRIESVNGEQQYHLRERNVLKDPRGMSNPFMDANGAFPPPGFRYHVILAENKEEILEFALCGSNLEILRSNDRSVSAFEIFGNAISKYYSTDRIAGIDYSLTVLSRKLIVSLDFSSRFEHFLKVRGLTPTINTQGNTFGLVSFELYVMAQILPFEMLIRIIRHFEIETVIFTGSLWSGSVAHIAAILLRGICIHNEEMSTIVVKAISFYGPLCGSRSLSDYIAKTGQLDNHITLNDRKEVADRLIADVQSLAPLESWSVDFWQEIYTTITKFSRGYFQPHRLPKVEIDLNILRQVEARLRLSPVLNSENTLKPIGKYIEKSANGEINSFEDEKNIEEILSSFDVVSGHYQKPIYTLPDLGQEKEIPFSKASAKKHSASIEFPGVQPKITSFRLMMIGQRVQLHFVGENLDSVVMRWNETEEPITFENIGNCPVSLKSGKISIQPSTKLLSVKVSFEKSIVEFSNCHFPSEGEICVKTDFGPSNFLAYTSENFIKCEETPLSKCLHPTMNALFLSAAFLRVAISCKKNGKINGKGKVTRVVDALGDNSVMISLWKLLCDLELRLLQEKNLEDNLLQYINEEIDISMLRNMAINSTFVHMSNKIVEDFVVVEYTITKIARKTAGELYRGFHFPVLLRFVSYFRVGALGMLLGGILGLASLLVSIPLAIVQSPVAHLNLREDLSSRTRMALGVYNGITGFLAIPGAILGSLGLFLALSGKYAFSDYQSPKYKKLLKSLITIFGGDVLDVVDELPNLEDAVVQKFSSHFPECDLRTCSLEDLKTAIERAIQKENSKIETIKTVLKNSFGLNVAYEKLLIVGRVYSIRNILEHNFMIGFIGVHNAGKSTLIQQLFGVDSGASLFDRTEEPTCHLLGSWISPFLSENSIFREWFHGNNKAGSQLYAIDFPGTTDERQNIALMTEYTLELASLYIVVLKAGHIAGPEKDVVNLAIKSGKPFIVLINQCDMYEHEFSRPGGEERAREKYSKSLEISDNLILFVSAKRPMDIDRIRCIIFGMVQNLFGNSSAFKTLPFYFVTNKLFEQIKNEVSPPLENLFISAPEKLVGAISSLLYNCSELTLENVVKTVRQISEGQAKKVLETINRNKSFPLQKHDSLNYSGISDMMRQYATELNIHESAYTVCVNALDDRVEQLQAELPQEDSEIDSASSLPPLLGALLGFVALNEMHTRITTYFGGQPIPSQQNAMVNGNDPGLFPKVLLGMHLIFTAWLDRGYNELYVKLGIRNTLLCNQFNEAQLLQTITELDSTFLLSSPEQVNLGIMKSELEEIQIDDLTEVEKYKLSRSHLLSLSMLLFPTWSDHSPTVFPLANAENIEKFRNSLEHFSRGFSSLVFLTVRPTQLVQDLLSELLDLTQEQLENGKILFNVVGESGIDVDGITRSVLTKAAQLINENPGLVRFKKYSDTEFIYFDPKYCYSEDLSIRKETGRIYRAFGRMIGLCLRKFSYGATMPLKFPLSIYKWMLRYRLSSNDLSVMSLELSRSVNVICSMEEKSLQELEMNFEVALDEKHNLELVPNGAHRLVTVQNRIEFLKDFIQYYLCCLWIGDSTYCLPTPEFLLGIQHLCPIDAFNHLSPVLLQSLIEGQREIDVEDWKAHTMYSGSTAENSSVIDCFWEIVAELDNVDRSRLLCFSTGTSSVTSEGFQALNPPFTLVIGALPVESLPVSHTCFHMLSLPRYKSKEMMKEKLLFACRETDTSAFALK